MEDFKIWGQFAVAAIMVIIAGYKLTRYGDIFSFKFNLGHVFVGAVLIGWCTSLPELVLSLGTAVGQQAPNITMGNVLGSNLFNLFILVLLDIVFFRGPILRKVSPRLTLSAILSMIMVVLVASALYLHHPAHLSFLGLQLGWDALIIFGAYLVFMLILYVYEKREQGGQDELPAEVQEEYRQTPTGRLCGLSLVFIAVIIGAGLWISSLSTQIADHYKLEQSFVGALFLAMVSSLPEVITAFTAIRLGFHNMALGIIFGSNIFNMAIISVCDLFLRGQNIFMAISSKSALHISTTIFVLVMSLLAIYGMRFKKEHHKYFMGTETFVMGLCYLLCLWLIYCNTSLLQVFQNVAKMF